jgi:MurNAc alpha-1-phosphate uridylyltransferase
MPKAIVLAAGFGTRMRPLTDHLPKPLIAVAGITLLDRALDWLAASGVEQAIVNSHYKAELLEAHLAGRIHPHIAISREDTVLETGGGILQALPWLGQEMFIAVNGDVICLDGKTPALQRLQQHWGGETMDALLLVHPVAQAIGYDGAGDFWVEGGGTLRRRMDAPAAPYVFTGIQLLHPRLFAGAPSGAFSLNTLYNRAMKVDGTLSRVRAIIHDGHWLHVGDPQGLHEAERFLLNRPA